MSDLARLSPHAARSAGNTSRRRGPRCIVVSATLALIYTVQVATAAEPVPGANLGFETAILNTLKNHPSLAGQLAEVEAKDHAIAEARSLRLPSLNGQLGQEISGGESVDATLLLRQPVWTFGRISRELDYARTDRDAELAAEIALRRSLAERAGTAYARVLGTIHQLAASEIDTDALAGLVNQIRRRADARLASHADVVLAESRLVQMRATQERLGTERELAEAELLALTQTPVAVNMPIPDRYTIAASLPQLEAKAFETAPSLLRGEHLVALAQAGAARERTRAYPTVYLEGRRTFGDDDEDLKFGIVVEGGLDGLGAVHANRARALDASARAAAADLALARTELERHVRTLHASRASRRALIDGYAASIDRLDTVLASYQRQYEAGRKGWLELLNLYREVAELRLQLEQAHTDWTTDSISLAAATGQLDNFSIFEKTP